MIIIIIIIIITTSIIMIFFFFNCLKNYIKYPVSFKQIVNFLEENKINFNKTNSNNI